MTKLILGNCHNNVKIPKVRLCTRTWANESNELFDYESRLIMEERKEITEQCKIVRRGINIHVEQRGFIITKSDPVAKSLANFGLMKRRFYVFSQTPHILLRAQEELWIVLKDYTSELGEKGMRIMENDIIRMGKWRFRVLELSLDGDCSHRNLFSKEPYEYTRKEDFVVIQRCLPSEKVCCRICLSQTAEEDNPMIESPCACSGSIKYMHFNCLKEWIKSKITEIKTECTVVLAWNEFECDICKKRFPERLILANNEEIQITKETFF